MPETDSRPLVLLVDDEQAVVDAVSRNLRKDFRVVTACGAQNGLRAMAAHDRFDLVMTDLHMPNIGGGEFLEILSERYPDVPRILFTGDTDPVEVDDILRSVEVYDVLFKPLETEVIRDRVRAAIEHFQTRRKLEQRFQA
ncbi:MAG: response regulator [Rhodobacteraceae bacterium]|nr:response regulator [Paracoccaceae bacterium]